MLSERRLLHFTHGRRQIPVAAEAGILQLEPDFSKASRARQGAIVRPPLRVPPPRRSRGAFSNPWPLAPGPRPLFLCHCPAPPRRHTIAPKRQPYDRVGNLDAGRDLAGPAHGPRGTGRRGAGTVSHRAGSRRPPRGTRLRQSAAGQPRRPRGPRQCLRHGHGRRPAQRRLAARRLLRRCHPRLGRRRPRHDLAHRRRRPQLAVAGIRRRLHALVGLVPRRRHRLGGRRFLASLSAHQFRRGAGHARRRPPLVSRSRGVAAGTETHRLLRLPSTVGRPATRRPCFPAASSAAATAGEAGCRPAAAAPPAGPAATSSTRTPASSPAATPPPPRSAKASSKRAGPPASTSKPCGNCACPPRPMPGWSATAGRRCGRPTWAVIGRSRRGAFPATWPR